MTAKVPPPAPAPRPAEGRNRFEGLAALLAPAAGCDCQMLALTIADGFTQKPAERIPPGPKIAER